MFDRITLLKALVNQGYVFETLEHPPLNTVEEAQRYRGPLQGTHIKNLVLRDRRGALYLVVMEANRRLHLQKLRRLIDCTQLSFAPLSVLNEQLGVQPGSVSPLALINAQPTDINLVMDQEVMAGEFINVHPLDNRYTVQLRSEDLRHFLQWRGFEPIWLNLVAEDPAQRKA